MKLPRSMIMPSLILMGLLFSAARGGCTSAPSMPANIKIAPDFTLPIAAAGPQKNLTLSEVYRDRPVLLVFWATWCPTCISEIGDINEWQRKNRAHGVKVIGVNLEETEDRIQRIQARYPMEYDVVMDSEGSVAEDYGIDSLPTLVLLAKGGEILYYGVQLPRELERLLSARA